MKYRKKQQTSDEFVQERLNESGAERARSRLMLEPVRDLAEAWCLVKPTDLEIRLRLDETRQMIEDCVREYWGAESHVDFDLEPKRRVTARHSDGRKLVIGEEP